MTRRDRTVYPDQEPAMVHGSTTSSPTRPLRGRRYGLVCHPASVTSRLEHAIDALLACGEGTLAAVFGPQHGVTAHTQDNMIEWQGYRDPRTGLPIHSLYGAVRKPTPAMLAGLDLLVVDLQDVGCRATPSLDPRACHGSVRRGRLPVLGASIARIHAAHGSRDRCCSRIRIVQ